MKIYTTWQLAEIEHVHPSTTRRWVEQGKYEHVFRTKGGEYRIGIKQEIDTIIYYARVSSTKQKPSINTQFEIIEKNRKEEKT